jgi:Uncharacterized protein conserved in bacteria
MCCAPCAVYPVETLLEEGIELEGLFYNPNIHPIDEYEKRRENVQIFSQAKNIKVNYNDDFRQKVWEEFKGEEISRCTMCYDVRMEQAARYAAENGFDAFTTSLLVSPYQKHELIKALAQKYSDKYAVDFYYKDFRPGFRQGQQKAKELGLYRQKFCGCIISKGSRT